LKNQWSSVTKSTERNRMNEIAYMLDTWWNKFIDAEELKKQRYNYKSK